MNVISAGALAALILEGLKWIFRKYIIKDPNFAFDPKFYLFMLPVLNFILIPALAFIQVPGYALPSDWNGWAIQLIQCVLASLVSVFGYEKAMLPLKNYSEARALNGGDTPSMG